MIARDNNVGFTKSGSGHRSINLFSIEIPNGLVKIACGYSNILG